MVWRHVFFAQSVFKVLGKTKKEAADWIPECCDAIARCAGGAGIYPGDFRPPGRYDLSARYDSETCRAHVHARTHEILRHHGVAGWSARPLRAHTLWTRARIVTRRRGEKTQCNLFFSYFGHFLFFLFAILRPPARTSLATPQPPSPSDSRGPGQISWFTFAPTHPGKGAVESAKMCRPASELEKVDFGNTGGANRIRDTAGRRETGTKGHSGASTVTVPGTVIGERSAGARCVCRPAVEIRRAAMSRNVEHERVAMTLRTASSSDRKRRCFHRVRNAASILHPVRNSMIWKGFFCKHQRNTRGRRYVFNDIEIV